jgi:capsid protein
MRVGRMDETDEWIGLQEHFISTVCVPVFERWLMSAMLKGQITVPDFNIEKANAVAWQGRRWVSPKPLEDIEVAEREIALGVNSRSRFASERGDQLWDIWDELSEENEYAEEKDLAVDPPRKGVPTTTAPLAERPPESAAAVDDSTNTDAARVLRLTRGA